MQCRGEGILYIAPVSASDERSIKFWIFKIFLSIGYKAIFDINRGIYPFPEFQVQGRRLFDEGNRTEDIIFL